MAWLQAVPNADNKLVTKPRIETRKEEGFIINMPSVHGFELIVEYLEELGFVRSGVSGPVAIGFSEIESWARLTGLDLDLQPWAVILLRRLSVAYANQASVSNDPRCPQPHVMTVSDEEMAAMRKNTDKKVRQLFNG